MRIVTLVPAAAEIVFELGLGDEVVARSSSCDFPPEVLDVPVVTRPAADAGDGVLLADRLRHALHGGLDTLEIDAAALVEARPDLVLTHAGCDVCRLGPVHVRRLLGDTDTSVVGLEPDSVEGVFNSISTIGAMTEAEDEAIGLLEVLRERLGGIEERVRRRREQGVVAPRVVCLGWIDPPHAVGAWLPEQVRRAGGWDLLAREGGPVAPSSWDAIRDVDPVQLLLAPYGLHVAEAAAAWRALDASPVGASVSTLSAIRRGELVALDSAAYFSRPGPRIVEGIALLAELFDPRGFIDEAPADGWIPLAVQGPAGGSERS